MFYIDVHLIKSKRDVILYRILPAVIVLVGFLLLTFMLWGISVAAVREEQANQLSQKNVETIDYLVTRMNVYENMLRGGTGLFTEGKEVTREDWKHYVASYEIEDRYPGVQGIGYAELITSDKLAKHIQKVRSEGFGDYAISPAGSRDIYSSIIYIEPFSGANLNAFGYDMYAEPVRKSAMDAARDTGEPAMSDLVTLAQDRDNSNPQPGFLMYLPVYTTRTPSSTEERRSTIQGFVYAPFRSRDLIKQAESNDDNYAFQVYKLGESPHLLYESSNFTELASKPSSTTIEQQTSIYGTTWKVIGVATPGIVNQNLQARPTSTILTGILFSVVFAGFVYLVLTNRSTALSKREEQSVQEAKDELLALASHQLRTPATGVKQYIGMLKAGMVGAMNDKQLDLLQKAYDSNERQLLTINEMLYVSRADAGQLNINKKKIDLSHLLNSIVDEMSPRLHLKQQAHHLHLPNNHVFIFADQQFLRMAIENIISNASKYTKDGGSINVKLVQNKQRGRVEIIVSDNGVGVAKRDQKLLFKKFSRIPNELTNKVIGSGIGLYLARKIIEAHGGTISFTSDEGQGSVVRLKLPVS